MWIPGFNAIGLMVIGIGNLITILIKKRKADTTKVTIVGAENSLQINHTRITVLFASEFIAAGSTLGYFDFKKKIRIIYIAIIDKCIANVQSHLGVVFLGVGRYKYGDVFKSIGFE